MKISKQTAAIIILCGISLAAMSQCWKESKDVPAVVTADTIILEKISEAVKKEDDRLRSQVPTLKEKLTGVDVMAPTEGEGPVIIYNETIDTDTALAKVAIKDDKLSTRLQVPADSGKSRWVDLPVKDVGRCQGLEIGGNGTVRCDKPVLGVLDLFADVALGVDQRATIELQDRVGLDWRRFRSSSLSVQLSVKPSDIITGQPRIYVGVSKRFNLLGN